MWNYVENMKKYVAPGPRRVKHQASRHIHFYTYINAPKRTLTYVAGTLTLLLQGLSHYFLSY